MQRIFISENQLDSLTDAAYKKWKRLNVAIRGVKFGVGQENNAGAMLGSGLYLAALSNKSLARQYGKVYFVVNGKPKNPKIFNDLNSCEIWLYNKIIHPYGGQRIFNQKSSIEKELLDLGYDGILINGREMVNFSPPNDVLYFETEDELKTYYKWNIQI
jgi:hypothetical protein